ncbi:Trp biosynthesis-associated membrane protein [Actinopolyspora halophila]|uniref:Trp biosynthesis-associated membrane protein n=1 Tax=Actinopolyspora halophila TaxID=1850 RepID=UPI00036645CA|nr:Trp biosynthesis-associated membrane protein [Actinopolyspora halophila]
MTGEQESGGGRDTGRRLLVACVIGMIAVAVGLWAAGSLVWVHQRYRTPFSGESVAEVTGATIRGELTPLALATLAAIAAVLATGGLMRRVIGLIVLLEAALLTWRLVDWITGSHVVDELPGTPPGTRALAVERVVPYGPILMGACAAVLLLCGLAVLVAARRMPAMGAKYSAPSAEREPGDPDQRIWEALDKGRDPTENDGPPEGGESPRS